MDDERKTAEMTDVSAGVFGSARILDGKYVLGRLLGEGGMGAVYEAEHKGLAAKVAVKLLSEAGLNNPKSMARFRREAHAMAAINHENIVKVMDTGNDVDGVPYLVMEHLEGESLSAVLRREKKIQIELATWITGQILSGLVAAHSKGVVHRDLKPGNVFIGRQDDGAYRIKILDFGISKIGDMSASLNVTAAGAMVGTPNFMAPEQIRALPNLDGRIDVYATGIIFYRMVTGHLPFTATDADELYKKILDARPIPPRQHNPNLPIAIEAIITKAMHPNRDHRFSNANEFLAAIHEHGTPQPTPQFSSKSDPLLGSRPPPTQDLSHTSKDTLKQSQSNPDSVLTSQLNQKGTNRALLIGFGLLAALAMLAFVLTVKKSDQKDITVDTYGDPKPANDAPVVTPLPNGPALRFGVAKHTDVESIKTKNEPLLKYLSTKLQREVTLEILENFTDISKLLDEGKIDLAALPSYQYVIATKRKANLELVATPATRNGTSYEGYILVKAESKINSIKKLRGKSFCYVSHNSTSGYLYPRAVFRKAGLNPDKLFSTERFTSSHTASLKALNDGVCDGAAVYAAAWLNTTDGDFRADDFSVIARTEKIPWDAYVARSTLEPALIQNIQSALLELEPGSESAKKEPWLGTATQITGFVQGNDTLYDPVRRLEKYLDSK